MQKYFGKLSIKNRARRIPPLCPLFILFFGHPPLFPSLPSLLFSKLAPLFRRKVLRFGNVAGGISSGCSDDCGIQFLVHRNQFSIDRYQFAVG